MSLADELLNSIDETSVPSNSEVEGHIIVDISRKISVPDALKRIGVQYDHNVETVTFDCPRYWDEHDMSTMGIYINYSRADGVSGSYIATNVRASDEDENLMHFDWVVSRNVTMVAGKISFLICIKDVNEKAQETMHWNSEMCSDMFVSPGLECAPTIYRQYADIIEQLRSKMSECENLFDEKIEEMLSHFTDVSDNWQPIVSFTLDGKEFEALVGQTWYEWCAEHPEYGYVCDGEYVYGTEGTDDVVYWFDEAYDAEYPQYATDIIENHIYYSIIPTPTLDTITFTVNGLGEYTAISGMTWYEWCNSEYNTGGFWCVSEDDVVYVLNDDTLGNSEDQTIYGHHHIYSGEDYIIYYMG